MGLWQRIVATLYPSLHNTWMNDADVLAQIAHVAVMALLVSNAGWLFGPRTCLYAAGAFAAYAVVKEWVYDAHFELPKQTWRDNLLDMAMLWLGIGAGLLLYFVAGPAAHR